MFFSPWKSLSIELLSNLSVLTRIGPFSGINISILHHILWGWPHSVRSNSFCETGPILWARSHSVRTASFCEDGLILRGRPQSVRPHHFLWGKTSLCKDNPHYVRTTLIMWGKASLYEANVHLWGWPHSHCLVVSHIISTTRYRFSKFWPHKSDSASELRLHVHVVYVRLYDTYRHI